MCKNYFSNCAERNLLLGNGINAHIGIQDLSMEKIAVRFASTLQKSNIFFATLFGVFLCDKLLKKVASTKAGIETLADNVYQEVLMRIENPSDNDKMRLLSVIKSCAITAIFYDGCKRIGDEYHKEKVPDFSKFKNIFTLNYSESWDKEDRCIYLHGKYHPGASNENGKEILLYSSERVNLKCYDNLVKALSCKYDLRALNTREIIFSPTFYETKSEAENIGCTASTKLFPGADLFPHRPRILYKELCEKEIRRIEVFGMSPDGDNELIDVLNEMDMVIIYIYNYDDKNNNDIQKWEEKLTCPHIFLDSMEIMK